MILQALVRYYEDIARKDGVEIPRSYHDYAVTVEESLPVGFTCKRMS